MANIIDYIKWRGDLKFTNDAFNEVDNVILAELAYINFSGIVPAKKEGGIRLRDAAGIFLRSFKQKEIEKRGLHMVTPFEILKNIRRSRRFGAIILYNYIEDISDYEGTQFSAVSMKLDDKSLYIAYSGTDDTIAGWRENFTMSFAKRTVAQQKAVDYINESAGTGDEVIRVGGHSKGGNLAVYASIYCDKNVKDRIRRVFNNDGPGFTRSSVPEDDYNSIVSRIETIIPTDSIVGMLLEHDEDVSVVKSINMGIAQHDTGNWQLERTKFIRENDIGKSASLLNKTIVNWLARLKPDERKEFINVVFDILQENNIKTLGDLTGMPPDMLFNLFKDWGRVNAANDDIIGRTMKVFWEEGGNSLKDEIGKFIENVLHGKKQS